MICSIFEENDLVLFYYSVDGSPGIQARLEHPFRLLKRQFGHANVRHRGLAKNTAQLHTLLRVVQTFPKPL